MWAASPVVSRSDQSGPSRFLKAPMCVVECVWSVWSMKPNSQHLERHTPASRSTCDTGWRWVCACDQASDHSCHRWCCSESARCFQSEQPGSQCRNHTWQEVMEQLAGFHIDIYQITVRRIQLWRNVCQQDSNLDAKNVLAKRFLSATTLSLGLWSTGKPNKQITLAVTKENKTRNHFQLV